jgi:hypothetical protein
MVSKEAKATLVDFDYRELGMKYFETLICVILVVRHDITVIGCSGVWCCMIDAKAYRTLLTLTVCNTPTSLFFSFPLYS